VSRKVARGEKPGGFNRRLLTPGVLPVRYPNGVVTIGTTLERKV